MTRSAHTLIYFEHFMHGHVAVLVAAQVSAFPSVLANVHGTR